MAAYNIYPRRWVTRRQPLPTNRDDVITVDVISGDAAPPADRNEESSSTPNQFSFRLVSCNILTDNCIRNGQYLYCPADIRYMATRHGRIMAELRTLDPDIVCLQEADEDNFRDRLEPEMNQLGYAGINRATTDGQGLATFWRRSAFELIGHKSMLLSESVKKLLAKSSCDEETKNVLENWVRRPEVTTVVHLRHLTSGKEVAIGNNHIGWMVLRRPTLQALQIAMSFRELLDFADQSKCPLVFCGDFNTPPSFPGYQFLSQGWINKKVLDKLAEHHEDIDEVDMKNFSVITQAIPDIFQLPVHLKSAYFAVTGREPGATNCDGAHEDGIVRSFCLDYIWYRKLDAVRALEAPPLSVLTEQVALPSSAFPSDHIPIAADFLFTR